MGPGQKKIFSESAVDSLFIVQCLITAIWTLISTMVYLLWHCFRRLRTTSFRDLSLGRQMFSTVHFENGYRKVDSNLKMDIEKENQNRSVENERRWRNVEEKARREKKCHTSAVSSSKSTELKSYQQKSFDFRRSKYSMGLLGKVDPDLGRVNPIPRLAGLTPPPT